MKIAKRFIVIVVTLGVLGTAGVALASAKTPVDIAAEFTGKTVEELYFARAEGQTLCSIVEDAGKLEEFKEQILEQKKAVLEQRVEEGKITPEQADVIYNKIKENQANCDGTGKAIGKNFGAGFGQNGGIKHGKGTGRGAGIGIGRGVNSFN